jgi:hypothetical protein
MIDRGGWPEADVAVMEFGAFMCSAAIGRAVRKQRTDLAALCNGVTDALARGGARTETKAHDLFIPLRGSPDLGLPLGLIDLELGAA